MDQGEIIIYQTPDGQTELDVNVGSDTVWLTQAQIALLFGTQRPAITKHLQNFIWREEEQMINGTTPKKLWFGNSLPRTDYTLVDDREVFRAGSLTVEGILASGHTAGMMAYLVNDKYLFTGDIIALKDGRVVPTPKFFDMNHEQALAYHAIIGGISSAEYIFTGHWGFQKCK